MFRLPFTFNFFSFFNLFSFSNFRFRLRYIIRFVLHFGEMVAAMYVGMLLYMPVQNLLPSASHQVGMALFMAWPMVVWMRVRGHAWRHGFEMAAAMLIPWAALVGLQTVLGLSWIQTAAGVAMYLGMLGYMLVRREHLTHVASNPRPRLAPRMARALARSLGPSLARSLGPRLKTGAAYLAAIVLVPALVGFANLTYKTFADVEPMESPSFSGLLPAPPTPDPNRKTAVVLAGSRGAEIGDTLESYEILARSGLFNVYSIAPERTVLPLKPGFGFGRPSSLDFVPHFSFAEYDAQIGGAPDLIAIPYFEADPTSPADAPIFDWIRDHAGPNTTILSICSGTMILADTGLLANRTATTNTGTFDYVQSHSPSTALVHNVRYVDDGNIITSTNLTGGVDATLHLVDRLAGRAAALDVAHQIGYSETDALDDPSFAPDDSFFYPITVNAALSGQKERLGVRVDDGVSELGLAGIIDPLVASGTARPIALADERRIIASRYGFLFLPRYDAQTSPALDRVVVPPAADAGVSAYDAMLRDLAQRHNGAVAQATANGVFFAADARDFAGAAWPVSQIVTFLTLSLCGAALAFGLRRGPSTRSAPKTLESASKPLAARRAQTVTQGRPTATCAETGLSADLLAYRRRERHGGIW
jgi:putative intracellular protease/amidase